MKQKLIALILMAIFVLVSLTPATAAIELQEPVPYSMKRVVEHGYFGVGGLDLNSYANRAQFATIAVRFSDYQDDYVKQLGLPSPFRDVNERNFSWASPYVALAYQQGLMQGVSDTHFDPGGNVTYIQLLTVMMRLLGYQHGEDFTRYPDDYYAKAVELGLADRSMAINANATRETVAVTMERTLDLQVKGEQYTLAARLGIPTKAKVEQQTMVIEVQEFNTVIQGFFSGQLSGANSFTGFTVELISAGNKKTAYGKVAVESDGSFALAGFDIGAMAQLLGYKYRVYNEREQVVLEDDI